MCVFGVCSVRSRHQIEQLPQLDVWQNLWHITVFSLILKQRRRFQEVSAGNRSLILQISASHAARLVTSGGHRFGVRSNVALSPRTQ